MSTYSKNLFDILGDGEVARPQPVKEEAAPVVIDKKNVSKINKDGKYWIYFLLFFPKCVIPSLPIATTNSSKAYNNTPKVHWLRPMFLYTWIFYFISILLHVR